AIGLVSAGYLEEDDAEAALSLARSIEDVTSRDKALRDIAEWQAGEGDRAGALATAEHILGTADRAIALSDIAEASREKGDGDVAALTAKASELVLALDNPAERAVALIEIARAQAAVDGVETA